MSPGANDLLANSNNGTATTKDIFLQQAREARVVREMAQRQEQAATNIQAFFKSIHCRNNLKREVCEEFTSIVNDETKKLEYFNDGPALLNLIRKLIFNCDKVKEKDIMNRLIHLISSTNNPKHSNDVTSSTYKYDKDDNNESPLDEDIRSDKDKKQFDAIIIEQMIICKEEEKVQQLIRLTVSLVNLCLDRINETEGVHTSLACNSERNQSISDCLNIVNGLINLDIKAKSLKLEKDAACKLKKIVNEIISKTIMKKSNVLDSISKIISYNAKNRTIVASESNRLLLLEYVKLFLKMIQINSESCQSTNDNIRRLNHIKEMIGTLKAFLTIPAIILVLHDHSTRALELVNDSGIFLTTLSTLTCHYELIEDGTSPSRCLCIVANLIQLSYLNEDILRTYLIDFSLLVTKLFQSCRKNRVHNSNHERHINDLNIQVEKNKDESNNTKQNLGSQTINLKPEKPKDVSYNPILGWLARDKDIHLDKDQLVKQLRILWSKKYLLILFDDLFKTNDDGLISGDSQNKDSLLDDVTTTKANQENKKNQEDQVGATVASAGNVTTSVKLLRRVTDRWKAFSQPAELTYNESRTTTTGGFITNYVRPRLFGGSNASKCKLLTPEAFRIGAICELLNSAIDSLVLIKQDILTNICMHHDILVKLWAFIKSRGPNNGLIAYLELLPQSRKQQTKQQQTIPEFQILAFFCECTSNLINVLDDSELYDTQKPFKLDDVLAISSFMNNFVYQVLHYTSNNVHNNADCWDFNATKSEILFQLIQQPHKLLKDLYTRDCRRRYAPKDHWFIKEHKVSTFLRDIEAKKLTAFKVLQMLPHIIPRKERVQIFRKFVSMDKLLARPSTLIAIHRSRIVEDGYQQLARLAPDALKGLIRVKFINDFGLGEAGIDQDGVFKEFLEDTMKRVFDPALNLFKTTSEQCLYPSPMSCLHENYESLFNFVGKMLGKAVYEGIMVDLPFAPFFLRRVVGQPQSPLYSPLDELPSLDPELFKSLTYIKHYEGDVSELALTFCIDQDFLGRIETHELEPGGRSTPVTRENRVRYIHLVADFHLRKQIARQTHAFVRGFQSIIEPGWLSMFSASDLQNLISGDNMPIDLHDLRRNTKYSGGFHNNHKVISWLWDILDKDFTAEEHKLFLKFVTSCSKPPLLGFSHLEPPFSIRCIEVSDDLDLGDTLGSIVRGFLAIRRSNPVDRLPTSSTCFNLLKLPNYQRRNTLKEKLRYAIHSNAGFELS